MTTMWLLPQNPGPFGTLAEWKTWQKELRSLGPKAQGVDVELAIAEKVVSELEAEAHAIPLDAHAMALA